MSHIRNVENLHPEESQFSSPISNPAIAEQAHTSDDNMKLSGIADRCAKVWAVVPKWNEISPANGFRQAWSLDRGIPSICRRSIEVWRVEYPTAAHGERGVPDERTSHFSKTNAG